MGPEDLQSYVEETRATVEESDKLGRRNTELRLVEPFLERLGWDVRSPAVEAAYLASDVGATVDYALLVDSEPAIFVEVLPYETELTAADGDELVSVMTAAGVEWGILTNGRTFAFVARRPGGDDGFTCSLEALPDHAMALRRFTPEKAREYVRTRSDRRRRAARRLLDRRESLESAIVDEVAAVADDREVVSRVELKTLTSSFVERAAESLAPGGESVATDEDSVATDEESHAPNAESTIHDGAVSSTVTDAPDPDESTTDQADSDSGDRDNSTLVRDFGDASGGGQTQVDAAADTDRVERGAGVNSGETPELDDGGEYVARLFDGSTSVCAVGGSSVAGTMKEVVDYLVEQHHLHAGLTLPYVPGDDGGYAVLHRVPEHPNGQEMARYVQLDSGPYLWTEGSVEEQRRRIEALADRTGLRVMFQGDWAEE